MGNGYSYDVSIIFVNYFTSTLVSSAIKSVREKSHGFTYEILIVDNSNDAPEFAKLEALKEPGVCLIDAKGNLGFGKANNLGSKYAKGRYLYFLNTDTLLINNAINELKMFLDQQEDVGIVGSNLYSEDMEPNTSFERYEWNLKSQRRKNTIFSKIKFHIFKRRSDFNYTNKPALLEGYVIGASLMIRRPLFDALDGFDKDIFMYAEETMLCYRLIHELHYKIYNVPSSKIIHFHKGSQINFSDSKKLKLLTDGTVIYYRKAFGKDAAIQYLKNEHKYASQKYKVFKILHNKVKCEFYTALCRVCEDKLSEFGCSVSDSH